MGVQVPRTFHAVDGMLMQVGGKGAIWLIQGGKRRVFPTWDTFVGMGFSQGAVVQVSPQQAETVPLGDDLPPVDGRTRRRTR